MRKTFCDFCGSDIPEPSQANSVLVPNGKYEDVCLSCKAKIEDAVKKVRR